MSREKAAKAEILAEKEFTTVGKTNEKLSQLIKFQDNYCAVSFLLFMVVTVG